MTNQEIFDRVLNHLRTQRVASFGTDPRLSAPQIEVCLYRGPANTTCAVGCLIPDDLYDPDMEGQNIGTLARAFPELLELFPREQHILLNSLQYMHDSLMPRPGASAGEHRGLPFVELQAQQIATYYLLTYTPEAVA